MNMNMKLHSLIEKPQKRDLLGEKQKEAIFIKYRLCLFNNKWEETFYCPIHLIL